MKESYSENKVPEGVDPNAFRFIMEKSLKLEGVNVKTWDEKIGDKVLQLTGEIPKQPAKAMPKAQTVVKIVAPAKKATVAKGVSPYHPNTQPGGSKTAYGSLGEI